MSCRAVVQRLAELEWAMDLTGMEAENRRLKVGDKRVGEQRHGADE
jgi:hypothetical protein